MSNDNFNFMFSESNTFTSSAGGLGFTSSIKKTQNFNFTPSPKSDNVFLEEHHSNKYFFEMDTHENTPLDEVFNLEKLETYKGRSNSQKLNEELFANCPKEKNQICINSSNKKSKYLSSKIKTNIGKKIIKKKKKPKSIEINKTKFYIPENTIKIERKKSKNTSKNLDFPTEHLNKNSTKEIKNFNFGTKPKTFSISEPNTRVGTYEENNFLSFKNSSNIPKIKKDFKILDKESLVQKFKNSLKLRKRSFKEDPNYLFPSNNQFELNLPSDFSDFFRYENLNSSRMNVYNFYEHTEECFKIISCLEKKKSLEKKLNYVSIEESLIKKITQFNQKLILFDLNETLLHYSFENVNEFDHIIKFEVFNSKKEKDVYLLGVNLRPHLFEAIKELSKDFVLGIFTSTEKKFADKLIDFIDPNKEIFKIKLYKEHCEKVNNPYFANNKLINMKNNTLNDKKEKINCNKNITNNFRMNKINEYIIKKNNTNSKIEENILNEKQYNLQLEDYQTKNKSLSNTLKNDFLLKEYFYIKDLLILNKIPLEKIVIIDNSILSFYLQISNGIPIFPFYEDKNDNELRVLVNYLKHLKKFEDIRPENKAILKLDYIYKDLESQNEFSYASSVENNNVNNEFLYDSEINDNFFFNLFKEKNSNKNTEGINNKEKKKLNNQTEKKENRNISSDDYNHFDTNNFSKNSSNQECFSPLFNRDNLISKFQNNNYKVNEINNSEFLVSFKNEKLNLKHVNIEKENKDFFSFSLNHNQTKNLNFSFGNYSDRKEYFSNKSIISNKSGFSSKSSVKNKLYICLEELHYKFTDYFKKCITEN